MAWANHAVDLSGIDAIYQLCGASGDANWACDYIGGSPEELASSMRDLENGSGLVLATSLVLVGMVPHIPGPPENWLDDPMPEVEVTTLQTLHPTVVTPA